MEPAVDRAFTPEHRALAAEAFGGTIDDLTLLGDFENYVFRFEPGGAPRILRITHTSHRSADDIRAEIDWVAHLRAGGLEVCSAIPSGSGAWVEEIGEGFGSFLVSCFEHAPGARPTRAEWGPELFERWGAYVGRSHRLTRDYVPGNGVPDRMRWDENPYVVRALDVIPEDQRRVRSRFEEVRQRWADLAEEPGAFGICHTDLHQENFHVADGRIVGFDTDDCEHHWLVQDISSVLYHGYHGPQNEKGKPSISRPEFVEAFLPPFWRGYRTEYDLDEVWLDELPLFLMARRMTIYVLLHLKWDVDRVSDRQAAWMAWCREAIEDAIPWADVDFRGVAKG